MTLNRALLVLWCFFFLLSPHLISTQEERDYTDFKGSQLVKLLISQNREIRHLAFYELRRRLCPQVRKSYTEFKKKYKIVEAIVCPTGKERAPVYLVLYDYDFWSSDPDRYYSIPDREIFEKDQEITGLAWKDNISISAFDSAGGNIEIPGGSNGLYSGVIADINGDGFIEMVDIQRSRQKNVIPPATILKIWVVKEIPRCIFALMYNLVHGDWGYALEDQNNDGIYDILLGPGKPGKVTPMVTYKWDTGKGIYYGPRGGEGDGFKILDAADIESELKKTRTTSHITFREQPGKKQMQNNYNKPYQYTSLKDSSNREILEYMKEGNSLNSLECETVKPVFPENFWQKPPGDAVLELVEMNRHSDHKRQFQIAIDNSPGLEHPAQCGIFYSYVDNPFYTGYRVHYFIRCTPGDSYLAYGVCSTSGLFHPGPRDQEAIFKFRMCQLPDDIAGHFAHSAWLLNRVRSRRLEDDRGVIFDSFSSADGTGTLKFKSGKSHIDFSITASDRAMSIAETWNDQYDKETCLNFFTYLLHYGLKEKVKSCLDDSKPQLPGKDQRTGELAEFFMKNFSPDEAQVSIPLVAEAVRYAGATAFKKYLPLIEKIDKQLNQYSIPRTRTANQVYDEIKSLEAKKQGPGKDALNKKINVLKEEFNRVEVGISAPVALDRLRGAIRQAKKKIALARDGAALEKWVKSGKDGTAWATRKLKNQHPQRYIKLLEQRIQENKGFKAIEAFNQLEDLAPELIVVLSKKILTGQRKDLFVPAFRVLVRSCAISDIENWLPKLTESLTSPDTKWERGFLIRFLIPKDNPLKYRDGCIDRALGTLLDAGPKDERVKYILKDICLALAQRGRIEYFSKIKEWFDKADTFSEKGDILLTLTYLALRGKGRYLTELERLLGGYLKITDIKIGDVIRSVWAGDFIQFRDRLAEIATSGPEDYEDRAAYTSGSDKDVDGRYHMARKVCALWNEKDPFTRCKLWIAFGLEDYYEIMKHPACKLRITEELSRIASNLNRQQKDDILIFIDFCHRETLNKWKKKSEIWEMMRKIFLT